MNVVIEETKARSKTIKPGDVVAFADGAMLTVCRCGDKLAILSLDAPVVRNAVPVVDTSDGWLRFWDDNWPNYTIYPADEYELVLRRKRT